MGVRKCLYFLAGNKAMKPCKCGYLGDADHVCTCSESSVASYRQKISGPLLDRIDLHVTVPRVAVHVLDGYQPCESSAKVRQRVEAARATQRARGTINSQLPAGVLTAVTACDESTQSLLKDASDRFALSPRVQHKVLRVARTVADLAGKSGVEKEHLAEAIRLRGIDPRDR